jgi:hypothetical protein
MLIVYVHDIGRVRKQAIGRKDDMSRGRINYFIGVRLH